MHLMSEQLVKVEEITLPPTKQAAQIKVGFISEWKENTHLSPQQASAALEKAYQRNTFVHTFQRD